MDADMHVDDMDIDVGGDGAMPGTEQAQDPAAGRVGSASGAPCGAFDTPRGINGVGCGAGGASGGAWGGAGCGAGDTASVDGGTCGAGAIPGIDGGACGSGDAPGIHGGACGARGASGGAGAGAGSADGKEASAAAWNDRHALALVARPQPAVAHGNGGPPASVTFAVRWERCE
eukprot:37845-Chlamydomonas_euryale.AAC.1